MEAPNDCAAATIACSDEDLFKQPPPREECPICMLPLPLDDGETDYQACCGKVICCGCMHAVEQEIIVAFVHFAELLQPLQMGSRSKGSKNEWRVMMPRQCTT